MNGTRATLPNGRRGRNNVRKKKENKLNPPRAHTKHFRTSLNFIHHFILQERETLFRLGEGKTKVKEVEKYNNVEFWLW